MLNFKYPASFLSILLSKYSMITRISVVNKLVSSICIMVKKNKGSYYQDLIFYINVFFYYEIYLQKGKTLNSYGLFLNLKERVHVIWS